MSEVLHEQLKLAGFVTRNRLEIEHYLEHRQTGKLKTLLADYSQLEMTSEDAKKLRYLLSSAKNRNEKVVMGSRRKIEAVNTLKTMHKHAEIILVELESVEKDIISINKMIAVQLKEKNLPSLYSVSAHNLSQLLEVLRAIVKNQDQSLEELNDAIVVGKTETKKRHKNVQPLMHNFSGTKRQTNSK